LEDSDKKIVIDAMEIKKYTENEIVIQQGDSGDELYIVCSGELTCSKIFEGNTEETFLKKYIKGEVFGELSLLYNTPRAASIKSNNSSVLFCLDRDTFNNIVKTASMKKREKYESFLKEVKLFKTLDVYEICKLSDAL